VNESDQRLLSDALARALAWHGAQKRKGTEIPYASHLLQVAGLVLDHGGDVEQAAAALLHDTIEDCDGVDGATLRALFGERVARIVVACTDTLEGDTAERKSPWEERKRAYLAHLAEVPADALLVAACDKRQNLGAIVADLREHGPGTLARFRPSAAQMRWYYAGVLERIEGRVPERLARELGDLLAQLDALTGRPERG
jgi:(p)ppGpp synthase/HD superfamily hydrolase